jgi:hypothetical protein
METVKTNPIVREFAVQEVSNSLTLSVQKDRVSFCSKVMVGCGVMGFDVLERIQTVRGSDSALLLSIIPRHILSFGILYIYIYIVTCQPIVGLRNRALLGNRPVNKTSAQTR